MLTIKQIRIGAELTAEGASKLCGCSTPTYLKWEKNPAKMELGAFNNLLNYYNEKNPTRKVFYDEVEF